MGKRRIEPDTGRRESAAESCQLTRDSVFMVRCVLFAFFCPDLFQGDHFRAAIQGVKKKQTVAKGAADAGNDFYGFLHL